jgi:hypothetical protein
MPICVDCGCHYKGEPPRDERCEERHRDRQREQEDLIACQHCNKTFLSPAAFDNHRWSVYYSDHFMPKSYHVHR